MLQASALEAVPNLARSGRPILVWGARLHTQRLLGSSELGSANITAFIDSDPAYQGGELIGRPILSSTAIRSPARQPGDPRFFVEGADGDMRGD